jgi:eukaryotic-like serine/threonine-protein kinase
MSAADSMTGQMIDGRYKVLSRLGAGGMADVFLAEDQQLGRKVALKLMYRRFSEDPGFVERFRREAQAAAGLQHPNVVSVYDRGSYDDTYYIAMEYLPGRSLKQLIRQEAPLDPVRAINITLQILKAARFAHRRGVIHRDLKPHNVIIDESDHAKVTDFGIARAGASDMTETGSIMGTAQYLSPEQAQGLAVSPGSDLYSIGVILYELVTGRVPFDAESAVTIAIKHVSDAPPAPRSINPNVPPELEQVILWALNKNPTDRPTDADQFINALEQVKAMIESGQGGPRTTSFASIGAAEAYGAADAYGAIDSDTSPPAVGVLAADEEPEDEEEPEEDRRRRWLIWGAVALLVLLLAGGAAAYLLTRPEKKLVPPVVNEQVSIAQAQLQNAGFQTNVINRTDPHPSGTVIAQNPLGGTKANKNSTITLTVSQGPGNAAIPSVRFLKEADAKRAIKQAQLKVSRTQQVHSDVIPPGDATGTDPQAGQQVPIGSGVTLFISSGRPNVSVPDVVGQTESSARSELSNRGLTVAVQNQVSSTATPGNVLSQSPTANASVAPGSTVTIVVAQAPPKATVPNVKGQKQGPATNALTGAGFKVAVQQQDTSDPKQKGIVLDEIPAGNTSQTQGSTVTIVVGHFTATTTTTPTSTTPSTHTTNATTTSK